MDSVGISLSSSLCARDRGQRGGGCRVGLLPKTRTPICIMTHIRMHMWKAFGMQSNAHGQPHGLGAQKIECAHFHWAPLGITGHHWGPVGTAVIVDLAVWRLLLFSISHKKHRKDNPDECEVSRDIGTSARRVDIKMVLSLGQHCTWDSSSTRGAGAGDTQDHTRLGRVTNRRHQNESGRHHESLDS